MRKTVLLPTLIMLAACGGVWPSAAQDNAPRAGLEEILVAGGCFWCIEADLEKVPGVDEASSGYAGGRNANPTYQNYSANGHREVALVRYDPAKVSFETLARVFIRTIDVTDDGGQFCDRGYGYTTAVYLGPRRSAGSSSG